MKSSTGRTTNFPEHNDVKPKLPMTGFFRFQTQKREDIKKNFPQLSTKELVQVMAQVWQELTAEEKKPY